MTTHKRTLIREKLLEIIKGTAPTYNTSAEENVFSNRLRNIPEDKLPSINIVYGNETATNTVMNRPIYNRILPVGIEVKIMATSDLDNEADIICEEIEQILINNQSISGTALGVFYRGVEIELNPEGSQVLATYTLNYDIQYIK